MVRRYYELPSLTALAAFEACARHQSFKRAAAELNVTPGAISRQIKALEVELGVPVFERVASGVALTFEGITLYSSLAKSFSRMSDTVKSIRQGDETNYVILACTDAFSSMWLIPRMNSFWRSYPEINVDFLISDDLSDFKRAEVELRIRFGLGSWPNEHSEFLMGDIIYPVCGPQFAAAHLNCTAADLPTLPLLHVDWISENWCEWEDVLRMEGIAHDAVRGKRFSKTFVALQAAQSDQGVAVGWDRLVRPMITDGKLIKFTELEQPAHGGYYLTWNDSRKLSKSALILRDWLHKSAADD